MSANKVIKKTRQKELLDDLLAQLEADLVKPDLSQPIEINEKVRQKITELLTAHDDYEAKIDKVDAIKREIRKQMRDVDADIKSLMKLYGLGEVIHGQKVISLKITPKLQPLKRGTLRKIIEQVIDDQTLVNTIYQRASEAPKPLRKEAFRQIIEQVVEDPVKVDEIYTLAEAERETTNSEKLTWS